MIAADAGDLKPSIDRMWRCADGLSDPVIQVFILAKSASATPGTILQSIFDVTVSMPAQYSPEVPFESSPV
ncbi:hypothetical protein EOA38_06295 [Mesorhizobium sp. M1E.F.Ca.ET.041.01.1.1]|nr:hypothetical protein EOA38_06295 [Mesorhizobium sp. M1E.F.Ca.ET.041.01.1.1]